MMRKKAITAILVAFCFTSVTSAQERKKSFFQKAAEWLAPAAAPKPARAMVAPVAPPNPANDAIKDERKQRVTMHMTAMLAWMDSVCELKDDQRKQIEQHFAEVVSESQDRWAKAPNRGEQNGNRDFIPFEFVTVSRKLTHSSKLRRALDQILTEEQGQRLSEALEDRDEVLKSDMVGLAALVLDGELFLSANQYKPVADELKSILGQRLYPGLFGFHNDMYPFQRAAFQPSSKLKAVLGDVRYKRFERLTRQNGEAERYVMITLGNGDGEASFTAAVDAQPKRVAEAMAVRIQFLRESHGLTDVQCRKLTIAAKGAASREIDKWIETSDKQMDSMRQQFGNQNISWGMSLLQISQVERNKLWVKTRDKLLFGDKKPATEKEKVNEQVVQARTQIKSAIDALFSKAEQPKQKKNVVELTDRQKYQRAAMVGYLVGTIDQEVWLRADQREPMSKLIDAAVSNFDRYTVYNSRYTEIQMLADVLFVVKKPALTKLLSDKQLAAWDNLKKQFKQQERYMTVRYRHGDIQFRFLAGRNR
jgi:hypothetical protein